MYGVPADLPLKPFVGLEFNQVALGRYQTQFHCAGAGRIFVEGRWELRTAAGEIVDAKADHYARDAYRLHKIIDVRISGFEVDPPRSFTIIFQDGYRLSVFDDDPQYEAFSIHLDGQPPMYV
jgi:hypothetical protein